MRTVKVYTKGGCRFSAQLEELLEEKEIPYDETVVENLLDVRDIPYEKVIVLEECEEHQQLAERSGMRSFPQVFIGSLLVGGQQEALAADQSGMLADLLAD